MSSSAPIVLLLRFRDLVVPAAGTTVHEHSLIIDRDGYAWWAWWKKQSEEIPLELWNALKKQSRGSQGMDAFLVDSGQRRLFRTTLFDLQFGLADGLISAPDRGTKTPAYYNSTDFATWFKIGKISPASEADLQRLCYLRAPHDDLAQVDSEDWVGRKIAGIDELLRFGNVTYWAATPASATSKPARRDHISARQTPPIAPRDIIRAESPRILHISDLHVAEGKHGFPISTSDAHNLSLPDAIFRAVQGDRLPGVVVVTGDLTWTGSEREFEHAFRCLDRLCGQLGLTRQHFVIIPGNHDLQWTQVQRDGRYDWNGQVTVSKPEARRNYERFIAEWYGAAPNPFLSVGRRFFLAGGPTLDILGLNSSELQQVENEFAGLGRITSAALDESIREFGWNGKTRDSRLRLLAVHHHLLPVVAEERASDAKRGFGIALDAETQLLRATELGVDLVLHGHQHHPYLGFTQRERWMGAPLEPRGILVLGAGSTGVADEFLGPIRQRAFNLMYLSEREVKVELFSTHEVGNRFDVLATASAPYGQPWQRPKR